MEEKKRSIFFKRKTKSIKQEKNNDPIHQTNQNKSSNVDNALKRIGFS